MISWHSSPGHRDDYSWPQISRFPHCDWFQTSAVWKAQAPFCSSYSGFEEELKRVFDHPLSGRQASKRLLTLRQGNGSAAEYAIQFRTVAAGSGWNDEALMVCFLNGLSEAIKDDMATREPSSDLETLFCQAIRLDNRLRERSRNRPSVSTLSASPALAQMLPISQDSSEPMQLGRTRLSPSERDRRMRERCCLYCGLYGHFRSACPSFQKTPSPVQARKDCNGSFTHSFTFQLWVVPSHDTHLGRSKTPTPNIN